MLRPTVLRTGKCRGGEGQTEPERNDHRRAAGGSRPIIRPETGAARDERAFLRNGTGWVERGVGGGVKVVEKWRFEIPEKSWRDFRSGRRFNPVFWRCQVAVRRKERRKKGFYEPWEENAKHRAGISNRQNSTTFDLTATRGNRADHSQRSVAKKHVGRGGSENGLAILAP